ncbi:PAS domain S-box protein [Singulisphaera sp. Ch08]|uniref:histidine kinase n=1 Tax=Singulisphaera sp. Ch08 TaxID=3120278 RepID=A0AAU7CKV9_9BACT
MSTSVRAVCLDDYRFFARAAGAAVIVMSGLVLVGWTFDFVALKSIVPGSIAMNPGGSAFAFLLAGASLWAQASEGALPRRRRVLGIACAVGVLLIGLTRVGGYLTGWDRGADQLLFHAKLEQEAMWSGHPNRMAPNTAAAFVFIGLALAMLDVKILRRGIRPAQFLALAAGLIAILALIGYAFRATSLIGVKAFIPMALNTAFAFSILSLGILCSRPERGLMAVISSQGAGGGMARRMLPAAILIPAAVGWVRWLGQRAGVVDPVMGLSLFVLADILIFTALVWWNAASLDRMDRERARAERRLGVQHTASRVLAESPRLEDAVPRILQAICESLGWAVGVMWWVDAEENVLRCSNLWCSPSARVDEFAALSRRYTFAPGVGLPGRVWASGQIVWIPDVAKDSNFPRAAVAVRDGLHGAFGFPIVVGSDILGVVEAFSGDIQNPDGELLEMLVAIGSQIGQFMKRKQAEEVAHHERFLLLSLMDNVPDSIYFKDIEGRFVRINQAMATQFGLSDPAAAVGKTDFDFFDDEHARQAREDEQAIMQAGQPVVGKEEKERWGSNGRLAWASTTKMPFRDKDGRVIGTFGISRDITAWKQAEEALRQSEERFRSLVEATVAIVWNTPESGEFETEQPGWSAYTGQTFDQLKGWGWLDAVHPDDRANTTQVWTEAITSCCLYQVEHRLRRYDGEYRHMLVRAVPVRAKDGGIREWIGVHTDIDTEKRAEAALREAEERVRLLLESSGEGIYGINMSGYCTVINRAAAAMLGYRVDEILGRNLHTLIHHSYPDGSPYPEKIV